MQKIQILFADLETSLLLNLFFSFDIKTMPGLITKKKL